MIPLVYFIEHCCTLALMALWHNQHQETQVSWKIWLLPNMVEKAINLKMSDFKLKVLRAQIYKELCYQYAGDESWKFNAKQIAERKAQFNAYKSLANKYYDEVALLDPNNAYDYQKLRVTTNYNL